MEKKKLSGLPTMADLVDMEFTLPDITVGAFDNQKDYEKWLDKLIWNFEELHQKNSELMDKMNRNINKMVIFLSKYPELFGENYGEVARDMMKFFYYSHTDKCEKLVDRISEIEKELNLPIH